MIVDLSRPYNAGMPVYPGDPSVELTEEKQAARDGYTAYFLRAGLHAGTHLDAPLHMIAGGEGISALPLSRFMAPGVLLSDTRTPPAREIPLGRLGRPEEIASTVLHLVDNPYITGQVITVDGGFLI